MEEVGGEEEEVGEEGAGTLMERGEMPPLESPKLIPRFILIFNPNFVGVLCANESLFLSCNSAMHTL